MERILFGICIVLFCIIILPRLCSTVEYFVSKLDGRKYVASDMETADTLARLHLDNLKLIKYMEKKYKGSEFEDEMVFLRKNYSKRGGGNLQENYHPTPEDTSYTTNKGDVIKICLRDPEDDKLYDYNTLMFVNLHELSHLSDRKIGHHASFWDNFKIVLQNAAEIGIYKPIDYGKTPIEYCGISISDNPYYN